MLSEHTTSSNPNGNFLRDPDPVNRLAQSAHDAVDKVAAKAEPAVGRLRGETARMHEAVRQRVDAIPTGAERMAESARGYVRGHPFSTVAAVSRGGIVLAFLYRRGSHR